MFHYLCSCKNESDILSLFSKVQGPWSFIYYQASSHSLWFGRDFLGHRSLLWHFRNLGKSFCLSLVGTQASGVAGSVAGSSSIWNFQNWSQVCFHFQICRFKVISLGIQFCEGETILENVLISWLRFQHACQHLSWWQQMKPNYILKNLLSL